ncbi:MAG: TatD family hydrolase [Rhodospirillaceae bacterium]|jgi:TatD DNase family protein|nr:TatD family hydrolase [Rhodospirillaceae bacterium]MBT5245040.1 TatD family hydrolase [Rhodospirillaceae bacterium]MBT5561074.1 TatD family hydrolase [Rhodospirillaceae bacterium]MBT6242768.1 TatD family hydrolase [Rhodospirillaceae bacterium]
MLVDSHCHLDFPEFADDMENIVERAADVGVNHMLSICTYVTKFEQVLAVAKRYENIYCTVGIHPHNADKEPEITAEHLIRMAVDDKVIGFGETGLDFYYDKSPRDIQKRQFRAHIEASREIGLPLVVHTRDADDEMAEILVEEMGKGAFTGLLHCFSSSRKLADTALELGLYLSISGIVTFKTADELRAIVRDVPLERLLVETDAPYLAPVPRRGKRNEPAFTRHTAEKIAEIKGLSLDEVAKVTTDNFFSLFSKANKAPST